MPAQYAGRVAAQTAKQVVLQRLREAEREVVFEEYSGREGDIVSGEMVRMEGRNVIIDLGKAEALLPPPEQVRNEHYRSGQRMKFYVLEVYKAAKGPQVVVSRTHKNLIRRLFELEVPEIFKGIVEIKAIAREGGYRSKVAVWSTQEGVDPVGACVGLRGMRIQNIVNELNGERIDVVLWDPEAGRFVAHALSPAQVDAREDRPGRRTPPRSSCRTGSSRSPSARKGQNARLAAKLTGWRIDIKSQSAYDEYMAAQPPEEQRKRRRCRPRPRCGGAARRRRPAPSSRSPEREAVLRRRRGGEAVAGAPVGALAEGEAAKPQIRFAEEILERRSEPARQEEGQGQEGRRRSRQGRRRRRRAEARASTKRWTTKTTTSFDFRTKRVVRTL